MAKKVVIIGAGIAGLSAGCYARMNGFEAEILEAQDRPGGLCTAWTRQGYTIDGSLEWLIGSGPAHPFHKLWRELGAVQGRKMHDREIFYRVTDRSGNLLKLYVDPDRLEGHLKGLAPEDSEPIEEFCAVARRMADFGLPPGKPPELMGPLEGLRLMRYYKKRMPDLKFLGGTTVADFAGRFSNSVARNCILNLFMGMTDMNLFPLVMSMGPIARKAGGVPEGGSLEFAKAIEKRFLDLGGRISYSAPALRVIEKEGRAIGVATEGREIPADYVLSCADLKWSLESLLGGAHTGEAHRVLLESGKLFGSSVMVSFGVDMDLSKDSDAIMDVMELPKPIHLAGREVGWFNYHNYSYDPSMAPKGKSVIGTILMTDCGYWEKLGRGTQAYRAEKAAIAKACADALELRYPGFRSKIEMTDVATPLTFQRYTNDWKGTYMTWTLSREYQQKYRGVPKKVPALEGFYLASMWTNPPGGVPSAAAAGRQAIQLVCSAERRRFRTSEPA
jgi:phytoene dehydrogenase-like protein